MNYDPITGIFTKSNGRIVGSICSHSGYVKVRVSGKTRYAHRVAWEYMTGEVPPNHIDHINGVKHDNRWCNLRLATCSENAMNRGSPKNSSTTAKNVYRHRNRWRVSIKCEGFYYLESFETLEEALADAVEARKLMHGAFARHN